METRCRQCARCVTAFTEKNGRQHQYIPLISKTDFAVQEVKKVINTVFSGAPLNLLNYLVDTHELTDEDIQAIEQRLAQKKQETAHGE